MAVSEEERTSLRQRRLSDIETCWQSFTRLYPTTQSCLMAIYELLGPEILHCKYCNERVELIDERSIMCRACYQTHWFTGGTLFEDMRRPDAWMAVLHFVQNGVGISANCLAKLVGCTLDTIRNCLLKVAQCIEQFVPKTDTFPYSAVATILHKRSAETPAGKHPRTESEDTQEAEQPAPRSLNSIAACGGEIDDLTELAGSPGGMDRWQCASDDVRSKGRLERPQALELSSDEGVEKDESSSDSARIDALDESQRRVLSLISSSPISFDRLTEESGLEFGTFNLALLSLEFDGLVIVNGAAVVRSARRAGNNDSKAPPLSPALKKTIEEFIDFATIHWHGVSRKYVQLYLTLFAYINERETMHHNLLADACASYRRVGPNPVAIYVSPLTLYLGKASISRE